MKINKNSQVPRLFKLIIIFILVSILLSFGSYYLAGALLDSKKNFEKDIHNQAMLQMNKDRVEKIRESRIQVSTITGKIIEIKNGVITISSQIYNEKEKIVRIQLEKEGSIYQYREEEKDKDSSTGQINYGNKEYLQFSDLKLGELITFSPKDSINLDDVEEIIFEVPEILINQDADINEM